jgi:AraC-like DNA-binding protein
MKKTRKRTVVRAILYFVGALLIINSVYLLFSSNIHTGIIAELVIGALFFFCAVFFKAFYEKTAVWFKFMCVAICAAICAAPLFLLSHGTADTANYNEDVLIVLGAGINGTRVGENLKRRLDAALDYIEKNYRENFSIADLSCICFVSESRLHHIFTEKLGITPIKYRNQIRVERAAHDLRTTSLSIEAIAEKHGFNSPTYFRETFKDYTGLTPTEHRRIATSK